MPSSPTSKITSRCSCGSLTRALSRSRSSREAIALGWVVNVGAISSIGTLLPSRTERRTSLTCWLPLSPCLPRRNADFAMASGELSKDAFIAFLANFLEALLPVLLDGAIVFVCIDWRHVGELLGASTRLKLLLKNICVWTKSNAGMGTFYRSQHEFVFVLKFGDAPHLNNFELGQHGRTRSNVWAYRGVNSFGRDRMQLLEVHPTVKPVLMIVDALKDVSRRGDLVLDPFLGSGSTLIAAEDAGRTCVGIELDPGYLEVAIRRWERRTGRDAVHMSTGETFAERVERFRSASPEARETAREAEEQSNG